MVVTDEFVDEDGINISVSHNPMMLQGDTAAQKAAEEKAKMLSAQLQAQSDANTAMAAAMRNAKKSKAGPAARKRKKGRGRNKKSREFGARKTTGSEDGNAAVEMTTASVGGKKPAARPAPLDAAAVARAGPDGGSSELGLPTVALKRKSSWRSRKDPASGKRYFYNKETGVTTWTKPDDYDGPDSVAVRGSVMAAATKRQTMQYASADNTTL